MIALSSASYTFENLHDTYKNWIYNIETPEEDKDGLTYFVSQLSYEALPKHMIEGMMSEEEREERKESNESTS